MNRFKYGAEGFFVPLNPKDSLNKGVTQRSDKVVTMIAVGFTITVLLFFFAHKFIMDITQFGFLPTLLIIITLGIIITTGLVVSVFVDRETLRDMALKGSIKSEAIQKFWGIQPDGIEEIEGPVDTTTILYDDGESLIVKIVNGSTAVATDDADAEYYMTLEQVFGTLAGINGVSFLSIDMSYNTDSDKIWAQESARLERANHAGKDFIDRKFIEQSFRYEITKNHNVSNTYLIIKRNRTCKTSLIMILQRLCDVTRFSQVLSIKGCSKQEMAILLEDYYNTPIDVGIGNYDTFSGEISLVKDISITGEIMFEAPDAMNFKIKSYFTKIGTDIKTIDIEEEESYNRMDIYSDIVF